MGLRPRYMIPGAKCTACIICYAKGLRGTESSVCFVPVGEKAVVITLEAVALEWGRSREWKVRDCLVVVVVVVLPTGTDTAYDAMLPVLTSHTLLRCAARGVCGTKPWCGTDAARGTMAVNNLYRHSISCAAMRGTELGVQWRCKNRRRRW